MQKKFRLFSHIFSIVLSVVAIALYFVLPLLRASAIYTVSPSQIKTMLSESFNEEDLDGALPETGVDVHMNISVTIPVLFVSTFSGTQAISKIIDSNVDSVAEELTATVGDITKTVTRNVIKDTIKSEIKKQIKDYLANSMSGESDIDQEAQEILDDLNKDGFLDDGADKIIAALYQDNATVASVTDITVSVVRDAINKLAASGNEKMKGITFDAETEAQVRKSIEEVISEYADENGNIDMDRNAQELLLEALIGLIDDYGDASPEETVSLSANLSSADTEVTTETETTTATRDEIRSALKSYINGIIPAEVVPYAQIGLIVLLLFFLASVGCWIFQLVKTILRLKNDEEWGMLKLPVIFGLIPVFLFMIIPSIVYPIVKAVVESDVTAVLSLSFFSSGICSGIAALLLIALFVAHYIIAKKEAEAAEETASSEAEEAENTAETESANENTDENATEANAENTEEAASAEEAENDAAEKIEPDIEKK